MSKTLITRVETLRNEAVLAEAELAAKGANATAEDRVKIQNILADGEKAVAALEAWRKLQSTDEQRDPAPKAQNDEVKAYKSWGQKFLESKSFKERGDLRSFGAKIEVKAGELVGMSGVAGVVTYPVRPERLADIVTMPRRDLTLLNLFPRGTTGNTNAIEYVRQTVRTNNAAETDELASKPQSVYDYDLVTEPIRTIAHYHIDTEQVLDDEPRLQSIIEDELTWGVYDRAQTQLISGNGTSPNLRGVLNVVGTTNRAFQASGRGFTATETRAEVLRKMLTDVRMAFFSPSVIIMNPEDAEQVELEDYTANKFLRAVDVATGKAWRVQVVEHMSMPAGTVIAADMAAAAKFYMRDDVQIAVDRINDQFIKNALTIRAEMRGVLLVPQPSAIAKCTAF